MTVSGWVLHELVPGRTDYAPTRRKLSDAQFDALVSMAQGRRQCEDAARLGISEASANDRRRQVREKLGAKTSAHAVALAYQRGLLR